MLLNYLLNTFNNVIIINYVEYLIHKLSHSRRFGGYLYKYHKIHHTVSFPPNRLMIEKHTENITMDQFLFGLYDLFIDGILFYHFGERDLEDFGERYLLLPPIFKPTLTFLLPLSFLPNSFLKMNYDEFDSVKSYFW